MSNISNLTPVFSVFNTVVTTLHKYAPEQTDVTQNIIKDKEQNPLARIMVYGVYNAGKSTLINALLGEERAKTADKPETDKVDSYRWGNYEILDTPGIDAPIEHEKVTEEQLKKADIVLFVANPRGVAEELATLEKLVDLLGEGKKVMLIFNQKSNLEVEEFNYLKDETRTRIQMIAKHRGFTDVLASIPIVRINAKTALKAKLENKENLLKNSGYNEFEKEISAFLRSFSDTDVIKRLTKDVLTLITTALKKAESQVNSDGSKEFNRLNDKITTHIVTCRSVLVQQTKAKGKDLNVNIRKICLEQTDSEQLAQRATPILEEKQQEMTELMTRKVEEIILLTGEFAKDCNIMQSSVTGINADNFALELQKIESESIPTSSKYIPGLTMQTVNTALKALKTEHVVQALQFVKNTIPSLMQGIGKKGIERIAGTLMTKLPLINTGFVLYDLFSGDSEENRLIKEAEKRQQAEERNKQAIVDWVNEISFEFETINTQAIETSFNAINIDISASIAQKQNDFDANEQALSKDIDSMRAAKLKLENSEIMLEV